MTSEPERVVFDCNVYLQALINEAGPAGRCVQAALDRRVSLFWTAVVVEELRAAAMSTGLRAKYPHLTQERLVQFIQNIEKVVRIVGLVPPVFTYERDPDDAHYVNLALVAKARLIVSRDKDLLTLMDQATAEGREFLKRFPSLNIMTPPQFLHKLDQRPTEGA